MNCFITIFLSFCFNFHVVTFTFGIEVFNVSFCNLLFSVRVLLICVIVAFRGLIFILEFYRDLSIDLDTLVFAFSKFILLLCATISPYSSGFEDPIWPMTIASMF